ncbi:PH domain-containing protein [Aquibacillus koreensis]|uniref:PH domain-containing protein n=1 Tax=Aquibacillus koreensis TaxID=279446 RepID=A0A9X3WRT8_9BACI|nr:PH domain-containing protein [Aquibacillus koreensis]MCT2535399.1 PH domain-containing protein [Aquibacillus koreensis]MDC3422234.1 PH domain-containing protein [Aquibacillus koreensis]
MNDYKFEHSLSPSFPTMRRISETISNLIGLVVLGVLFWLDHFFEWPTWAFWILIGLVVVSVLGIIWSFIEPVLLYRSWSYQFDDEYLQLSYGLIKKEWVTVPMTKIQSVTTRQGPIMKRYHTRSIKIETMGSSHEIPALEEAIAFQLRERLAEYAKLKEVDE